jgi:hypothetical protein
MTEEEISGLIRFLQETLDLGKKDLLKVLKEIVETLEEFVTY